MKHPFDLLLEIPEIPTEKPKCEKWVPTAGDRVRVYGANTQDLTLIGTVVGFYGPSGYPMVESDQNKGTSQTYHPKQIRRLKQKKLTVYRELLKQCVSSNPHAPLAGDLVVKIAKEIADE